MMVTEWNEFKQLDLARVQGSHALAAADRRSQHLRPAGDGSAWASIYRGMGRGDDTAQSSNGNGAASADVVDATPALKN